MAESAQAGGNEDMARELFAVERSLAGGAAAVWGGSLRRRRGRARGRGASAALRRTAWRWATTAQLRRSASSITAMTARSVVSHRAANLARTAGRLAVERFDLGPVQQLGDAVAAGFGPVALGHRHGRDHRARSRWTARPGAGPTSCDRPAPPRGGRRPRRRVPRVGPGSRFTGAGPGKPRRRRPSGGGPTALRRPPTPRH